jgi:hypothetical protein
MLLQLSLGPDESPEDVRTQLTLEHVEAHSADQIGWDVDITHYGRKQISSTYSPNSLEHVRR